MGLWVVRTEVRRNATNQYEALKSMSWRARLPVRVSVTNSDPSSVQEADRNIAAATPSPAEFDKRYRAVHQ